VTPFPGSYPTNPPLCHSKSKVRAVPTAAKGPHARSQQATVEDVDETDEEQEEDEEVMEDNLPWTHSPFTAGQYTPPLTLEDATTALEDLKSLLRPCQTSGIGHKDPGLDLLL